MDELSAIYSNVSRESLTYNGKDYDHLRDVLKAQVKVLMEQMNLRDIVIPTGEGIFVFEDSVNIHLKRQEQEEENQLMNSGVSEFSDSSSAWGISFEPVKVPLMITDMTISLDKLVPRFIKLGIDVIKMAVESWGGTRTKNVPDVTVLGPFLPVLETIIGFGEPILYEKYETYSEGGLLLTSPSTTFKFWTTLMPIFHVILFCGSLAGGDLNTGQEIRQGFVHGILPPRLNGVGVKQVYYYFLKIAEEIWKRGTCVEDWKDQGWEQWSKQFSPRSRCKASVVRDLVRFAKSSSKVSIQVADIETAAVAFALAQVKLCRIEALDFGRGPRIYGLEAGFRTLKLKASKMKKQFITYRYTNRKSVFNLCGVPAEFEEDLMDWLDDEIAKTTLLGIENGDPPGTVIMTPSFCALAMTGAIKALGSLVKSIAMDVANKCRECRGRCISMVHMMSGESRIGCHTVLFLNTLVSIYVAGVLLKGGMTIDQCTLSSDLRRTLKSLNRLCMGFDGLGSFLASWYILRTGEDAPHVDDGSVLGIEMDGKVHGLRYAVKPGTTGSVLVSFNGHIHNGSHVLACLVFEEPDQFHHELNAARVELITEQPPDVIPQQVLFIRSELNYIAVDAFLVYPNGDQLQVGLGTRSLYCNKHRCIEANENLAVSLNVSQCVDGRSTVKLLDDFKHALHTYGNEPLQTWISGAFPNGTVCFQGCRPLTKALALVGPKCILIEGSRQTYRAITN
ncbi:hypothetical protein G6F33_010719 [Rhizopus arrhizus]|nr:hypothetical protein G6F33_010719 [Rhizopus arrhizus]KAG0937964.1 hypothetical protein G6F32_009604 [Rhizopus arrhizus]